MIDHMVIAAGDFEGIFWLIIVIASIVAQLVKSGKGGKTAPPARPVGRDPTSDPREDLRKFFAGLSGEEEPKRERAAEDATKSVKAEREPTPVRRMERPTRLRPSIQKKPSGARGDAKVRAPKNIHPSAKPKPVMLGSPGMPLMQTTIAEIDAYTISSEPVSTRAKRIRSKLISDLRGGDSLRKAFVLSALVGKPLAYGESNPSQR